jgi:hypothetical protein
MPLKITVDEDLPSSAITTKHGYDAASVIEQEWVDGKSS